MAYEKKRAQQNHVHMTVVGRITRHEYKTLPSGSTVLSVNLAVDCDKTNSDSDEWVDRTMWCNLSFWAKKADGLNKAGLFDKVSEILVSGFAFPRAYNDNDGEAQAIMQFESYDGNWPTFKITKWKDNGNGSNGKRGDHTHSDDEYDPISEYANGGKSERPAQPKGKKNGSSSGGDSDRPDWGKDDIKPVDEGGDDILF